MVERVRLVAEVDVTILILRICSYASHFLPSPGYTLDKIRGVSVAAVRKTCEGTADSLAAITERLDGQDSLIRIQHIAFFGLRCQIQGNTIAFWEVLCRAIRVAQSIGIQDDSAHSRRGTDETDQEAERRTFCNLYIWDSLLSRQLDQNPFLSRSLHPEVWPQSNLTRSGSRGDSIEMSSDAPDPFTERLLQAHLADFWRSVSPLKDVEYDMVVGEGRYDRFCCDYLSQLPPAYDLVDSDKRWDKRLPKLPLQRQLLHIAIYDSLYWHFRPLLLLHHYGSVETSSLPTYKRVLQSSQEKRLAVAALRAIDGVTQLHNLLGGPQTRFAGFVASTFEAAVVLVSLCMDPSFLRDNHHPNPPPPAAVDNHEDPLQMGIRNVTRQGCLQAVQGALNRLQTLAEVSTMAEIGASTLTRLLGKLSGTTTKTNKVALSQNHELDKRSASTATMTEPTSSRLAAVPPAGEIANWLHYEPVDLRSMKDFMSTNETSTVGDMASWSSFDPSSMDSQGDFVSMGSMQDMQSDCATSIMDFGP
ncbi:MAG: hypothetical protein Q9221_005472 [Calogaya cf. arnoldii]